MYFKGQCIPCFFGIDIEEDKLIAAAIGFCSLDETMEFA
jgi:hypothetical protein